MSLRDSRCEDWRVQRFRDEIAEERAARLRAKKMRHAMWFGVALGLIGSFAFYL
jgi:hypothetical protein